MRSSSQQRGNRPDSVSPGLLAQGAVMESGAHPSKEKASDKGQTSTYNCLTDANRKYSFVLHAPLLPSLDVDVCCSGAPRTTEAAPTIPPGCSWDVKAWTPLVLTQLALLQALAFFQPSSTIIQIAPQLLEGHSVQLQRSCPHQPLPLAQMWPRQRLLRQVPQALHEGYVALVKAWAHGEWASSGS